MFDRQGSGAMLWSVTLVVAAIVFSFALACAMPFAAIGALAVLVLPIREAFVTAILGWLANQVIGFGFLAYPTDPATLAWGFALGLSAIASVATAQAGDKLLSRWPFSVRAVFAFGAALFAQQAVVFAASWPLPSHPSAFSLPVIWEIAWTNALACGTLGAFYGLGSLAGLGMSTRRIPG
ncbi:MAG: hypothetical protein AAGA50_06000 [Pseudomonadota bacterium]